MRATSTARCFERIKDEEHRAGIRYFEAVAHFNLGNSAEAVSLLKPIWKPAAGGRFQAIVGEVLVAAYTKLGEAGEAGEILSVLRDRWGDQPWAALAFAWEVKGEAVPVVTEVEANVLEYLDDLEPASRLREALSRVQPRNPSHLIKVFMLEFRRGREDEARAAITRLRYEDVKDKPQALIHMAEAYALLDMDGALPLAYRTRRLGFDDPLSTPHT